VTLQPQRFLLVLSLTLLALLGILFVATRFFVLPWTVVGPSMLPTLRDGDRVLVDLWTFGSRPPEPGEVVLFDGPDGIPLVKRITSIPASDFPPTAGSLLAREGASQPRLPVLGDNRAESADSRSFGPVPRGRFRGRVFWRYWPLSRFGPIR
jgi:signal peptidase I